MTLTYNDQIRRENDSEMIANLLRKGWIENEPPSYDAATQHEPSFVDGAWVVIDKTAEEIAEESIKKWANAQSFMAEFTMEEKGAIALSTDPTIAALRLELSTWFSQVYSNDPRVVAGLDKLVEVEIITETRRTEIITK